MSSTWKRQLKIDRYNLVNELERQAQLYSEWALLEVKAEMEAKEAENDYNLVRGEVENKIRRRPKAYDLDKVKITEAAVRAVSGKMPKVKKYYRIYMKALANWKTLKKAEKAFQQRKNMLEGLVSLNVQLHFADPKVPVEKREVMDRVARADILKQMKRRKIRRKRKR